MKRQYAANVQKDKIKCIFDGDNSFAYRYCIKLPIKDTSHKYAVVLMMNPSKANLLRSDPTVKFFSECLNKGYKYIYIVNISPILDSSHTIFDMMGENQFPTTKYEKNVRFIKYLLNNVLKNKSVDIIVATGKVHEKNEKYYNQILDVIKGKKIYALSLNTDKTYTMHYSYLKILEGNADSKKKSIRNKYKKYKNFTKKFYGTGINNMPITKVKSDHTFT